MNFSNTTSMLTSVHHTMHIIHTQKKAPFARESWSTSFGRVSQRSRDIGARACECDSRATVSRTTDRDCEYTTWEENDRKNHENCETQVFAPVSKHHSEILSTCTSSVYSLSPDIYLEFSLFCDSVLAHEVTQRLHKDMFSTDLRIIIRWTRSRGENI